MPSTSQNQTTPAFQKHQVIAFEAQTSAEPVVGFIETLTNKKARVVYEHDGGLRMHEANDDMTPDALLRNINAQPNDDKPVPTLLQQLIDQRLAEANAAPAKKGDVVSYTHNGEVRTGRVMRGGKRPLVSYSESESLEIPAHEVAPATLPQPDPALKEWAVSNWVSRGTQTDGEAMTATVTRNGVPVMEVSDQGDGAPCSVGVTGIGVQKDIDAIKADLNAYLEANNLSMHEPIGVWVEFSWHLQPTGLRFADYLPEFRMSQKAPSP